MRCQLISFGVTVCLAVSLVTAAGLELHGRRDDVEVRERVVIGDPDAAEGLTVCFKTRSWEGDLAWDTHLTRRDGVLTARTEFAYDPDDRQAINERLNGTSASMGLYTWGTSVNGDIDVYVPSAKTFSIEKRFTDAVAGRTGLGEHRTEVFRLADYFDALAWRLVEWGRYYHTDTSGQNVGQELSELFRVPVPPECFIKVDVANTRGSGQTIVISTANQPAEPVVEPYDGGPLSIDAWTDGFDRWGNIERDSTVIVSGEEGAWIYPYVKGTGGEALVEYKYGSGVYFIPRATAENWDSLSPSEQLRTEPNALHFGGTRLFYATKEEPVNMIRSHDGKVIELYTRSEHGLKLTAIDALTGEELSVTDLSALREPCGFICAGELTLVYEQGGGEFALIEDRDGSCGKVLDGYAQLELGDPETGYIDSPLFSQYADLAWDGARLAVSSDLAVMVMDSTGLLFAADYSLSTCCEDGEPNFNYERPVTVSFGT